MLPVHVPSRKQIHTNNQNHFFVQKFHMASRISPLLKVIIDFKLSQEINLLTSHVMGNDYTQFDRGTPKIISQFHGRNFRLKSVQIIHTL